MFLNDLWIADHNEGKLYRIVNDVVESNVNVEKEARAILVSQDLVSVYTVNRNNNTISHFKNGSHIKDITVGRTPWGICEDSNKNIYVSNYKDNTVTKIVNDKVVATYDVEAGPQGIICDDNDNVYVACSLSSTVIRMVNGVRVDSIEVGLNPQGITCDSYNNIWTANYGSNTVSKITNGLKILDVEVGKGPIAIVSDSGGNIFVANYLSDNVTILGNGAKDTPVTVPVGDGPTAISVNKSDEIYVTSGLGEDVRKIVKGSVVATINVCPNPSAFGDFTGCSTYNIYNIGGTSEGTPSGGWKISDLEESAQNAINKVLSNTIDTTATHVEYTNDSYEEITNVKEALDITLEKLSKEIDVQDLKTTVDQLVTYVGDAESSGLLKDVADLKAADTEIKQNSNKVPELETKVTKLETSVGEAGVSGILKDISDLKTANTEIKTNSDKVPTIEGKVTQLESSVGEAGVSGLLKDVEDLKTADGAIKINSDKVPELETKVNKMEEELIEKIMVTDLISSEVTSLDILIPSAKKLSKITVLAPADATITQALTIQLEKASLGTATYDDLASATTTLDISDTDTDRFVEANVSESNITVEANTRVRAKITNIQTSDAIKYIMIILAFVKQ